MMEVFMSCVSPPCVFHSNMYRYFSAQSNRRKNCVIITVGLSVYLSVFLFIHTVCVQNWTISETKQWQFMFLKYFQNDNKNVLCEVHFLNMQVLKLFKKQKMTTSLNQACYWKFPCKITVSGSLPVPHTSEPVFRLP